jgi:hypothetical protein
LNSAGFKYLHDQTGLKLLESPDTLDVAYHVFRIANDFHLVSTGQPLSSSYYNQACCLSLAVKEQIRLYKSVFPFSSIKSVSDLSAQPFAAGGVAAPQLPPATKLESTTALVNQRLDAALILLRTAVGAGYLNYNHMESDADLQTLREIRGVEFMKIVSLSRDLALSN